MKFEWGTKTYVMGILNVTPDSFSGDGLMQKNSRTVLEEAMKLGKRIEAEGADIIDVGGESTRPGSTPLSLEDELARVVPVIKGIAQAVQIPISVDTYKAEVARQALAAGASIINDVWGGRMDPDILKVAAEHDARIVLMHNRSEPPDQG